MFRGQSKGGWPFFLYNRQRGPRILQLRGLVDGLFSIVYELITLLPIFRHDRRTAHYFLH